MAFLFIITESGKHIKCPAIVNIVLSLDKEILLGNKKDKVLIYTTILRNIRSLYQVMDSMYRTFWNQQNIRDKNQISGSTH
jgi:hypothetical protein